MSLDRIRAAVALLVDELVGPLRYLGTYEYRVVTVESGGLLSLQSTDGQVPDLARVPVRPGSGGSTTTPTLGSLVHVVFVNGDPKRYVVVAFDDSTPTRAGLDATSVELGAAVFPVARYGDTVTVGSQTGPLTFVGPLPIVSRVKA